MKTAQCAIGSKCKSFQSRGHCYNKKSERVGNSASTQLVGSCHDKKSERAGCIASTQQDSTFQLIVGFKADSDFSDIRSQIFLHFKADSTFSRSLSATLQQLNKMCSTFQMVACEHQCPKFDPFVSCWDLHQCNGTCNAFRMIAYLEFNRFPHNSVEADSDFRDLQCQLFNKIISDSVLFNKDSKLIVVSSFPTNFSNTFTKLIVTSMLGRSNQSLPNDDFQLVVKLIVDSSSEGAQISKLIVNYILIPSSEGARRAALKLIVDFVVHH
jgi:hypothetical protein